MLGMCKWKGVQKGGHHSRTLVPTIHIIIRTSDRLFLNEKSDFLHNHWSSQYLGGCPPFAPLFSNFRFWKILNLKFYQNQKSTSYHIWFQIYSLIKSKNHIFRWNRWIWGSDWKSIIDQNRWFSSIINKNLDRLIFRCRDDINFIFGAKYSWGNVFYDLRKFEKWRQKGGCYEATNIPFVAKLM